MDGDLQTQDFGGLAEVVRVDDADDLAGEVANHRAMLLLTVVLQLVHVRACLLEVVDVDAGARRAIAPLGFQLFGLFLVFDDHADLRGLVDPRLKILQRDTQEGMIGIYPADALLAQLPLDLREVIDDAAEVFLKVIPHGRLRIGIAWRDVLQHERPHGRTRMEVIEPLEDAPDLLLLPLDFLHLRIEFMEFLTILVRQKIEIRMVQDFLDFLERQSKVLVVLDHVEYRALQDVVDAVFAIGVDIARLQQTPLVVEPQGRQCRIVELGHAADRESIILHDGPPQNHLACFAPV